MENQQSMMKLCLESFSWLICMIHLQLSDNDLKKLKNKCMIEIKTIDDIRSILSGNSSNIDPEILTTLLRKAVEKE
ncbi:unnamed protein product [Caenorhabditis nigoni]